MISPLLDIQFAISETEYVRVVRADGLWRMARSTCIVIGAGAVLALIFPSERLRLAIAAAIYVPMMLGIVVLGSSWHARRIYREQPSAREPRTLLLESDSFEINQRSGLFRSAWSDVVKWNETAEMVLLYINRSMFLPVPKDQLGDLGLKFVRERLAQSGLPGRGKRRRK